MKKSNFVSMLLVVFGLLVVAGQASAHSVLVDSVPGNAQEVPMVEELRLVYNEPVRMLRLTLVRDENREVDFGFQPNASAQQELTYPLPTLAPGDYMVTWTLIGSDGHTTTGSFPFTVDPTLSEATVADDHDGHHHHQH